MSNPRRKVIDSETIAKLEQVFEEFKAHGTVVSVYCDECSSLIELKKITDSSYEMKCVCGKFNDNLKGI